MAVALTIVASPFPENLMQLKKKRDCYVLAARKRRGIALQVGTP